jgi:hypothetical protein
MTTTVNDIPDIELLRRVVHQCRGRQYRKGEAHPRWTAVMDNFMLGSTFAQQLCRRFNFNPDEMVKR